MIQCYNCANYFELEDITKDHIPPECFSKVYPEEFKKDRLKVACCLKCNREYSKIDSELRDMIAFLKDGKDNEEFLKKAAESIVRHKQHGIDYEINEDETKINFKYDNLEKLFLKCYKGVFYHINGHAVDDKYVSKVYPKLLIEKPSDENNYFEKKHKELDKYILSGSKEIFKASLLSTNIIDNKKTIFNNDFSKPFGISCYMVFHGIIDCMVVGVPIDGDYYKENKEKFDSNKSQSI